MLKMSQINYIRDLHSCGYSAKEIQEKTNADPKTIRKYLNQDDFSLKPPIKKVHPSILDEFKETIDTWLKEDKKNWYKQRHTAKRVYDRLVSECGFTGSYSVVQRYIKACREHAVAKASLELVWEPGTAQVDFGEADFIVQGIRTRLKYLVVSFPYSNDSFCQVFGGENSECVCQGLKDIFDYIGGVPPLLIFDNATGIGKRIGDRIHESKLFGAFRAHYNFRARFCNPYAGYEKGHVESKVAYNRSNLFVPIESFNDILAYNKKLLDKHKIKAQEIHYKKQIPIHELFKADQEALNKLPLKTFPVCTYEWYKTDGYGKVCVEGKHHYSTAPEYARQEVIVAFYAHTIQIMDGDSKVLVTHPRQYGDVRTDTSDYSTSLAMLVKNVGAWHNSGVRNDAPAMLKDYMDSLPKDRLRECLKMMQELTNKYGYGVAVEAMEKTCKNGCINICDASVLADRIIGYGLDTPPTEGPMLETYDALLGIGGEHLC